ncbi:MAG: hypothetical protein OXE99_12810, partial [Cellvibrionales bacterium]|nr:hypothetical protein [Cellvibrionales bacterium]
FEYDKVGRKISQETQLRSDYKLPFSTIKSKKSFQFNPSDKSLKAIYTSPLGYDTIAIIDTRNQQVISQVKPNGETTKYIYDKLNRPLSRTDPDGLVSYFSYKYYDQDGLNAREQTTPKLYRHRTLYNAQGKVTAIQDWHNAKWRVLQNKTYNAFGELIRVGDVLGQEQLFTYDNSGRQMTFKDHDGNQIKTAYNDQTRTTTTFENSHKREEVIHKPWLRETIHRHFPYPDQTGQSTDAFFEILTTTNHKDYVINRKSRVVQGDHNLYTDEIELSVQRDIFQNPVEQKLIGYDQLISNKTIAYDIFNNPVFSHQKVTTSKGETAHASYQLTYDQDNQLICESSPKDGQQQLHTFHKYNANGQRVSTERQGRKVVFEYDKKGNLVTDYWQREGKCYQRQYGYDEDGHLITIRDNAGQSLQYSYTPNGLVTEIYGDTKQEIYHYDDADRLIEKVDVNGYKQSYTYLPGHSNIQRIATHLGDITFTYGDDTNGKKNQLLEREENFLNTGKVKTSYQYDALGLVAKQVTDTDRYSFSQLLAFNFRYQLVDSSHELKLNHTNNKISKHYDYDSLNRLISAQWQSTDPHDNAFWRYQYDSNNNVIKINHQQLDQQNETHYFYNGLAQLVSSQTKGKTTHYGYDDLGRLVDDGNGATLAYDDNDYLLRVKHSSLPECHYFYWPNGQLFHIYSASTHRDFFYDSEHKTSSFLSNGTWNTFVKKGKQPIASIGLDKADALMPAFNVIGVMDSGGEIVLPKISPYGERLDKVSDNSPGLFSWNDAFTDPNTQLTYLNKRFYHTEIMRFINSDIVGLFNRYAYAHANPVGNVDPEGLSSSPFLSYSLGSGVTLLGIIGALLAIPTGGASLSLTAAAGVASGSLGAISGTSMIGSQIAMDAGNQKASHVLMSMSFATGMAAASLGLAAVASSIINFAENFVDSLNSSDSALASDFSSSTLCKPLQESYEGIFRGAFKGFSTFRNIRNLRIGMMRIGHSITDGQDVRPYILGHLKSNLDTLKIDNALFTAKVVSSDLYRPAYQKANRIFPNIELLAVNNLQQTRASSDRDHTTFFGGWRYTKLATMAQSKPFSTILNVMFEPEVQAHTWYFDTPTIDM